MKPLSLAEVREVVEALRRALEGRALGAYVFGSIVDGSAVPGESDIDVLVIPEEGLGLNYYHELISGALGLSLEMGLPIHLIVYDERRHGRKFLEDVKRRGLKLL